MVNFVSQVLGFVTLASFALAGPINKPDRYEQIHQAEYGLADALDTKNYEALGNFMTRDIIYDNSALGPKIGGVCRSLDECKASIKASVGNAKTSHDVQNALIEFTDPTTAHVITYLTWSKWDPDAPRDTTKTFHIYEKCDDIFVLGADGKWRLKYSKVTNRGPKPEAPYYGEGA